MKRYRNFIPAIIILFFIAVSAVIIAESRKVKDSDDLFIRIYVDGELYLEEPLEKDRNIVIEQADGKKNIIHLTENGFYMLSSTCKNQLCVEQGEVTKYNFSKRSLGTHILCLPNRVDAELVMKNLTERGDIPDA